LVGDLAEGQEGFFVFSSSLMGEGTIITEGEFGNESAPVYRFGEELLIVFPNEARGRNEFLGS
jgi:hypothetical protein